MVPRQRCKALQFSQRLFLRRKRRAGLTMRFIFDYEHGPASPFGDDSLIPAKRGELRLHLRSRRALCPRELHRPVGFPAHAIVGGEGLFPAWRRAADSAPQKPDEDVPVVKCVRADEFPAAMDQPAGHWRVDRLAPLVEPPDPPVACGNVERPDRDGAISAERVSDPGILDIAMTIEDRPGCAGAREFAPFVTCDEQQPQPTMMDAPAAVQRIERRGASDCLGGHGAHDHSLRHAIAPEAIVADRRFGVRLPYDPGPALSAGSDTWPSGIPGDQRSCRAKAQRLQGHHRWQGLAVEA